MNIGNKIMLITYPDSMGNNLAELSTILAEYFRGVIVGVHVLPFYPSSADRGFAPITYEKVDPAFGNWNDLHRLNNDFFLMYDFMINHISRSSEWFQDFLENKEDSLYKDYFIRYNKFWPEGEPTQKQTDSIYKRKPRAPYIDAEFLDGSTEKIWCTFDEEQIDLDVSKIETRHFIKSNLQNLCAKGASIIRLDAFAYAIKKPDTSCFFIEPEVWELLDFARNIVEPLGVELLPEIHEHYSIQMKLAEKGYWVYDFALPMLVLHALYSGDSRRLIHWLHICPRKQFTTLDTHDGIGIVDVKGLLDDDEIEETKAALYSKGANVKKIYSTEAYNNLDVYQINCTFYSALNNDDAYLLARAIQFFTPGIPQIYYVGLLAGENDIQLLEETKTGRNINRHYYNREEIEKNLCRPVLIKLYNLMRFRNTYSAFDGEISTTPGDSQYEIEIEWMKGEFKTVLSANLRTHIFSIFYFDNISGNMLSLKL
ncbi:MAG: sucrose phosphorylase [Calditrichaeota bacterium]|nr:MAG: sucrose phosphorylase [Calditrichota bacterium]